MSVTQNIKVSVSEGLIHVREATCIYGHAFETFRVCLNIRNGSFSGVQRCYSGSTHNHN